MFHPLQHELLTHIKGILKSYDVSLGQGPRGGRNEPGSLMSLWGNQEADGVTGTGGAGAGAIGARTKSRGSSADVTERGSFFSPSEKDKKGSSRLGAFFGGYAAKGGGKDHPVTLGVSESQLILALQVLASPDFFSRQPSKSKRSRTITQLHMDGDRRASGVIGIESTGSTMLLRVVREAVIRYLDDCK